MLPSLGQHIVRVLRDAHHELLLVHGVSGREAAETRTRRPFIVAQLVLHEFHVLSVHLVFDPQEVQLLHDYINHHLA